MKSRLLSTLTFLLVLALSVAFASDKGSTTKKSTEAKKDAKGCCMTSKEGKATDKAAMECDPAEAGAGKEAKKPAEQKPEAKKDGDAK